MEPKDSSKKIVDGFKKTAKYLRKSEEIKDKVQTATESFTEHLGEIKDQSKEYLGITKNLTAEQLGNLKSKGLDLQKIFRSKDFVYYKTDAIAIVLRKLGKTKEFMDEVDKLTREGYRLVHQEVIRNIPLGGGFSFPLGSFYFFQHIKYITKS